MTVLSKLKLTSLPQNDLNLKKQYIPWSNATLYVTHYQGLRCFSK